MDTLKHYDRLRAAGVPDEQARAQVERKRSDARLVALRAGIRADIYKAFAAPTAGVAFLVAQSVFGG